MNSITLNKCRFFSYHGVDEQERVVGNHFEVTLKVYCPKYGHITSEVHRLLVEVSYQSQQFE